MAIDWLFLLLLLGGGIVLFFLIFFVIRLLVLFFLRRRERRQERRQEKGIERRKENRSEVASSVLIEKNNHLLRAQRDYIALLEKHIADLEKVNLEKRQLVKNIPPVHKPHELLDVNRFN